MQTTAPLLGVSACLLRGDAVLLVERTKPPFSGLLSLPGGRVEFGERLLDAIHREVQEETALSLDHIEFHQLHEVLGAGRHAVIAVYRGVLAAEAAPLAGDDAASLTFVPLAEVGRLEAEGRTTPGLADIVRSVAASLLR